MWSYRLSGTFLIDLTNQTNEYDMTDQSQLAMSHPMGSITPLCLDTRHNEPRHHKYDYNPHHRPDPSLQGRNHMVCSVIQITHMESEVTSVSIASWGGWDMFLHYPSGGPG